MTNESKLCGKCGSSLKDNVRFCTNCGAEIINSEKPIEWTTRDEFLRKYRGKKILEHIDEIINEGIGDKERLRSIYYQIDGKKELDDINFQYLKDCSDEFNSKVKPKDNAIRSKQVSYVSERKELSTKSKIVGIAIGFILVVSIIAAIVSVALDDGQPSEYELEQKLQQEQEDMILEFVKNYQGKDGKGETLVETLATIINVAYPNEDILNNPSTDVGGYVTKDSKEGIYQAHIFFETYREKIEFIFLVNLDTKEIFPGNEVSKSILDTIDAFD